MSTVSNGRGRIRVPFPHIPTDLAYLYPSILIGEEDTNIHCSRMIIAAHEGDLELVKSLPSTAREREKAFVIAAHKGHVDVMMYLFRQDVNIHADGNGALYLAALSERMDIVDLLLDMAGVSYTSYPLLILPPKARARVKRHMDMCAKLSSSVPDGVLYKLVLRYY